MAAVAPTGRTSSGCAKVLERLGLRALWRELAIAYFEWALDSIDPMHEDVPFIVHRINELKAERLSAQYRRLP